MTNKEYDDLFIKKNIHRLSFRQMAVILSNKNHEYYSPERVEQIAIKNGAIKVSKNNLVSKIRAIWQEENGELSDDEILVPLNGDYCDLRICNWQKLSKREHRRVSKLLKSGVPEIISSACTYTKLTTTVENIASIMYRHKYFKHLLTMEDWDFLHERGIYH